MSGLPRRRWPSCPVTVRKLGTRAQAWYYAGPRLTVALGLFFLHFLHLSPQRALGFFLTFLARWKTHRTRANPSQNDGGSVRRGSDQEASDSMCAACRKPYQL